MDEAKVELAPDFTVTDTQGNTVRLSDYGGRKHVVLAFNRTSDSSRPVKKALATAPTIQALLAPFLQANMVFVSPGSPTYATRQLEHGWRAIAWARRFCWQAPRPWLVYIFFSPRSVEIRL